MAEISNGKVNAALTTGIIGATGVALPLIQGVLENLGGNNNHSVSPDICAMTMMAGLLAGTGRGGGGTCSEDHCVNRYELGLQQDIAAKDTKIGLLESYIYTDNKISGSEERLNKRIDILEAQANEQRVFNATNTAALNCVGGQIAQLMALTRLTIPNGSVCPGWGNVTVTPATTPTTGA